MRRINTHIAVVLFCFFLSISQPFQTEGNQSSNNTTQTNSYLANRNTVLSTLRNRSSFGNYYSNATVGLSPNTVYGMFFCIGDISRTSCSNCVHSATLSLAKTLNSSIEAFLFSELCMVRYTNIPFFALVDETPYRFGSPTNSSLDTSQFFNLTLAKKLDEVILRASSSSILYFVEDQVHVTQLEGSYDLKAMVQCSPDLVPNNCTVCLRLALRNFFQQCGQPRWGQIFLPKCVIKYDISDLQPNLSSLGNTKGPEIEVPLPAFSSHASDQTFVGDRLTLVTFALFLFVSEFCVLLSSIL